MIKKCLEKYANNIPLKNVEKGQKFVRKSVEKEESFVRKNAEERNLYIKLYKNDT